MARKNLRKQVAALEKLAGLETLSAAEARSTNGGACCGKKFKHPKGTGAIVAKGSGKLVAMPRGTGAIMARGTGAIMAKPGTVGA